MCTVTYIPKGPKQFVLTSNRDEAPARSPQNLSRQAVGDKSLLFPRDTAAGGTWIAVSDQQQVVCLLNGAFERHHRQPPYRRSRGLMVLDYFSFTNPEQFFQNYEFSNIEPFTFLILQDGKVWDFRWDGQQKHSLELDPGQPHIWSSATLYPRGKQEMRHGWFADWLRHREEFSLEAIQDFHLHTGSDDPWYGLVMNRADIVRTVSMTNIIQKADSTTMLYHDFLRDQVKQEVVKPHYSPS